MAYIRPKHLRKVRQKDLSNPSNTDVSYRDGSEVFVPYENFHTSLADDVTINVNIDNSTTVFDSISLTGWEDETSIKIPVRVDFIAGNDTKELNYVRDRVPQYQGITVYTDSGATYLSTVWNYGDAIRIYSDGTGAGVRFLDSDVFRGGASYQTLVKDSHWEDFGGVGAVASAPDSAFRHTEKDSQYSIYDSNSVILTNSGLRFNRLGLDGFDFKIRATNIPYEFDSTPIAGAGGGADQASLDSANQLVELLRSNLDSAGDPEAWS